MATQDQRELSRSDMNRLNALLVELERAKGSINALMNKPALTDTQADMDDARVVKLAILHGIGELKSILAPPKKRVEADSGDDTDTGATA